MDESLIRELVARILASPQMEALLTETAVNGPEKKDCLVVLENEEGLRLLPEIQRKWGSSHQLLLCVAGAVNVPPGTWSQVDVEQALRCSRWAKALVPVCVGKQLAAVANGLCSDKVCEIVAHAICCGIPVEIGRVDYIFTDKTPEAYRKLFEGYEKKVAAFGVSIGSLTGNVGASGTAVQEQPVASYGCPGSTSGISVRSALQDPMPWSFGGPVKPQAPEIRSTVTYTETLMTEKEAILVPEDAILNLNGTTVLTPSAIDTLKRLKVQVFKEGVRFM